VPNPDLIDKLHGTAAYLVDAVPRPRLYGALLTVPVAHADVVVDPTALLRAAPGVVAVLGPQDDPGSLFSTNVHGGAADSTVFTSRSRFAGDVVGAVAAGSRSALRAALALAVPSGALTWTERPAVLDLDTALDARLVANDRYPDNLIADEEVGAGAPAVEAVFASCDLVHSTSMEIAAAPHGFLEPLAAGARWGSDAVEIWSPSQGPQVVRQRLRELLGHPVEVVTPHIGGGFGGKEELSIEPVAALLSRACGGQVVLVDLPRDQCSRGFRLRHGGQLRVTSACRAGELIAIRAEITIEAGPYDGHSSGVAGNAAQALIRQYPRLPISIRTRAVATNRTPGGAFRAYGSELAATAIEVHLDELADLLGEDPVALRLRHCARPGDADPVQGLPLLRPRAADCLQAADAVRSAWTSAAVEPDPRRRRGVGLALLTGTSSAAQAGVPDTAEVHAEWDGRTLTLVTGVPELGQGIVDLLTSIAVERTGLEAERTLVRCSASSDGPGDAGMFGNRGVTLTAVAAERAIDALVWEMGGALAPGQWTASGRATKADQGIAYGAAVAEVEVDTWTGVVRVVRVHAVHDVGRLRRPQAARGQVEGGIVQGVGIALYERATFDASGKPDVGGFFDHLVPTIGATPHMDVTWLCDESPHDAVVKGVGENTVTAVPAAIANALRAATGANVHQLPMTPAAVLDAIAAIDSSNARSRGGMRTTRIEPAGSTPTS
jgi:CO/xanthine dehydrogenase Mo-binding subunit